MTLRKFALLVLFGFAQGDRHHHEKPPHVLQQEVTDFIDYQIKEGGYDRRVMPPSEVWVLEKSYDFIHELFVTKRSRF